MKVITQHVCPKCKAIYDKKKDAEACLLTDDTPQFKAGDIVQLYNRYGWYDGNENWVINPEAEVGKWLRGNSNDDKDRYGLYYVVTGVELEGHRAKYFLLTLAMTGKNGHRGGYTYDTGHYTPNPVDAPEYIKEEGKAFIGENIERLL